MKGMSDLGEAKRRKLVGDKTFKGSDFKKKTPSSKVKFLTKLELDQAGIVRWV